MKKLIAFFYVFKKSLTSPLYYREILDTRFSFSFKYLLTLALFATAITSVYTIIPLVPKIKVEAQEIIRQMTNIYPEDLEITSKDGQWSINQAEPYVISAPEWMQEEEDATGETGGFKFPTSLVILDHNGTINDLGTKDTFVVVNGTNLIVRGSNKIEVYPLENIPDGKLTKNHIVELSQKIEGLVKYIPYFLAVIVTVGSFLYFFVWRAFWLIIVAILLVFISLLKRPTLTFKDAYRVGLHTFTLPLLLELILTLIPYEISLPNGWFLLVNGVFGGVVIWNLSKKKV